MSIEQHLAWVATLRDLPPHGRLEAVLRHYPQGADDWLLRTLVRPGSRDRLEKMLATFKRQGKARLVFVVDVGQYHVADEAERRQAVRGARARVEGYLAQGRCVREGTRDQKLWQWTPR